MSTFTRNQCAFVVDNSANDKCCKSVSAVSINGKVWEVQLVLVSSQLHYENVTMS